MFIKSIDLFGFKTFAEKTRVELSSGITAVVGPNGCGKSNIADGLLWVLGESNVRNIRGQRATDVIFNGTERKRSLGMAEASITLDNTCGTLPISYDEVTVTRRAFRSGEAEYFINKTRCRLKDIYELFLDTGIGREAYSMITQGQIDAVLSAKPEDRRELLEEAAGVKKYRHRRKEALRKLEKTEANLHRVCDIMSEISGQLEPLEEQAENAKRYNELQSRLNEIEMGLLIRDIHRHTDTLEEVRQTKEEGSAKLVEYDEQLTELEEKAEEQNTALSQLEGEIDEARRIEMKLSAEVQRLESGEAVTAEKLRSGESERARIEEELVSLEQKVGQLEQRVKQLSADRETSAEAESGSRASADAKSKVLAEMDAEFERASRLIEDQKAGYVELVKELADKRNALRNSSDRVSELETALQKYRNQIAEFENQKKQVIARSEQASAEAETRRRQIADIAARISQLTEKRRSVQDCIGKQRNRLSEVQREAAGKSSRLNTLQEMAESHEGFFEGVRSVMSAHKAGKLRGDYAVVADAMSVPKGYETAIETALGAAVQDIITRSSQDAKDAIAYLKSTRGGRATFLPLDNMRPPRGSVKGRMDKSSGALGVAADIVGYDKKFAPAIESLLGNTVVADNVDNAVTLSRNLTGWNKIVTLEGELIVASGAMTGGVRKARGSGLLTRKQEIESLTADMKRLSAESDEAEDELDSLQAAAKDIEAQLQENEKESSEHRDALADEQKKADIAASELERLEKQLDMARLESQEAETFRNEESAKVERLEAELQAVGQENTDLDRKVAGQEREVEELRKKRAAVREELMQMNVELAGCAERAQSLGKSLEESRAALAEANTSIGSRRSRLEALASEVEVLSRDRNSVAGEKSSRSELLTAAQSRLEDLMTKRGERQTSASDTANKLKETTQARNQLADDVHSADVKEARLEVQIQQASERLFEEYEMTREEALARHQDVEVERGTATEVARLRREIRDMGPVNTGAVEEYDRIKERWEFLSSQRADLENAKGQIDGAIQEIDTSTRDLFMNTFTAVTENFDRIFKRLFGGGKTELSLTNPDDLLETGIDVVVQIPGKKLQDMSLLSGGERALTACTFVFALLTTRPSPFVVLDEVDAPLDESNVERFVEVLKDFAKNSQFIVITHNRATMEAASNLYGITMEEPGVSKVISVKLSSEGPVEEREPSGDLVTAES